MNDTLPVNEQLYGFVDDLEKCLSFNFDKIIDCDNIVLYGMGGSAISGNVVADYCFKRTNKPVVPIMSTSLPGWINERTLAIVSSYSGNTLETIEAYSRLLKTGCTIIIITSGGYLKQFAKKYDNILIDLPDNLHPRHSIGYMIGYTLGIIRSVCKMESFDDILNSLPSLKNYRDELIRKDGIAHRLAECYAGKVPVICSYNDIQSIIFRWKTQFNENSKYVAFCTTISEFYYSNLNGWMDEKNKDYVLTLVIDENNHLKDENLDKMIGLLKERKIKYQKIALSGKSSTEILFRALMLGDYISIHLAEIQGVDPSGVPPVTMMKKKLKNILENRVNELMG